MPHEIKTGTVFIREGTLLPDGLNLESEPSVPGWRLIENLDPYAMDRKIREAGWTFFCLAGQIKATVFGTNDQSMIRRAVERILTKRRPLEFNSLEITDVEYAGSTRFPLVHYVTVSAQSRHIQESQVLVLAHAEDRARIKPLNVAPKILASSTELVSSDPLSPARIERLNVTGSRVG